KTTTADLHVVPHVAVLCGGRLVGVGTDGGGGDCGRGREECGHPGQEGPSTRSAPRSFSMSSPYVVFSGVGRHGAGSCVLTVRSPTETSGTRWAAMNEHHSEELARVRQEVSAKKFRSASTVGIEKGGKSQGGCLVRSGVQLSPRARGPTHPSRTR